MDTFENMEELEPVQPPIPEEPPAPDAAESAPLPVEPAAQPTAGSAPELPPVRCKASPYADSPYLTNQPSEPQWQPQPPAPAPRKPRRPKHGRRWLSALLIVALVAGSCGLTAACVNRQWKARLSATETLLLSKIDLLQRQLDSGSVQAPGSSGPSRPVSGDAMTPAQVYSANVDSVVAISSTVTSYIYGQSVEGESSGSGFVLTANGYIVTNYHVVEDAIAVHVTTHDGKEYAAEVVGHDSSNDVAVLKVDAEDLSPATIGSSSELSIGDMVVAIGNPLGKLTSTQTVGYVSGINREVTTDSTIINMIQTDAAINSGNSGGPLFNMQGQVVGITTAKYSGTTGSGASIEGISFAIPIDDVSSMISDLMDYGYVTGAYLGVTVQNNDAESAAKFGLPTTGAYVVTVEEGGAADRAGIQPKDIITQLGGYPVSTITDLTRALRHFKADDTTTVTIIRSGGEMTLSITLDEKPHDEADPSIPAGDAIPNEGDFSQWYDYFKRYFGG